MCEVVNPGGGADCCLSLLLKKKRTMMMNMTIVLRVNQSPNSVRMQRVRRETDYGNMSRPIDVTNSSSIQETQSSSHLDTITVPNCLLARLVLSLFSVIGHRCIGR